MSESDLYGDSDSSIGTWDSVSSMSGLGQVCVGTLCQTHPSPNTDKSTRVHQVWVYGPARVWHSWDRVTKPWRLKRSSFRVRQVILSRVVFHWVWWTPPASRGLWQHFTHALRHEMFLSAGRLLVFKESFSFSFLHNVTISFPEFSAFFLHVIIHTGLLYLKPVCISWQAECFPQVCSCFCTSVFVKEFL